MVTFTAKTEKELQEELVIPEGEYNIEVLDANDKTSKAGNEMIELGLKVFKDDGSHILVTDYLMEKILYKLKHACECFGLQKEYKNESVVANDFIGKTGKAKIVIQVDKEGKYPDKNGVKDYVVKDGQKIEDYEANGEPLESDDIPF
jgi:hypothetical protein